MTSEESAAYYQKRALREVGVHTVNAYFELKFAFASESGGSFTVSFNDVLSAAIDFPPTADQFKAALEAMSTIGGGGVDVSGVLHGPYYIEMLGANAGQVVPPMLVNGGNLNPVQTPDCTPLRQGRTKEYDSDAVDLWELYSDAESVKLRFLKTKLGLIDLRLGDLLECVDQTTGQVNIVQVKDNQRYTNMLKRRSDVLAEITEEKLAITAGATRAAGGVMSRTTWNGQPRGVLSYNSANGRYE